jgi:translation initiation factor 2-alpha kinase 4
MEYQLIDPRLLAKDETTSLI